ncbi:MAG: ATP-binding sensor histidine kinase [Deltaproteobacteria bacterium]|nr:ATP-binding sensor histidine kinase [Deltaproteobacteria bacterium]
MIGIPGYSISQVLYQGSRTIVYQGVRNIDSLPVVIKTLQSEYATPENSGRLKHEYEITRNFDLDGVVKAYGFEISNGISALILEDFGGVSLKSRIAAGRMETTSFLKIAIGVAKALGELHAHQIVHKDIKPSNIIVNPSTGLTKITDFGISTRLMQEYYTTVISDSFEGSVIYMSPEQTGRMNRAVDYRTDFYSAGVSFYELLTGQLPFQAKDQLEWVHCHIARPPQQPYQVNQDIPEALSAIIIKLMAKTPEERYQSAHGLVADLEMCQEQLESKGAITFFAPGVQDVSSRFRIAQKLYGRDREIETMMNVFARVCEGSSELVLVTGYSGIGKSSIVREIHKPVVKHHGYFISGKFDQFQRDTPYVCLIQAFRELVNQILTESDEAIARWKKQLVEALDRNGQVIIDVIPEVQQIIGEQQPLPELPSAESQNRFNMVFRQFVGVFARKEHPLVIFTDDLHWADTASLKLVQNIISAHDTRHILLIGAYRDNEVNGTHPLIHTLNEIRSSGATLHSISLGALGSSDITNLISESFASSEEESRPLAELLFSKTGGNPYFVNELLKTLHEDGLLKFESSLGRWQWDLKRIEKVCIADNMAELITGKLLSLPDTTRRALSFGACIGSQFTLATLALVMAHTQDETARNLWPAISGGFIISDGSFRIDGYAESQISATFSFVHDGVQQASYALMNDQVQRETHVRIGRQLLETATPEEREARLFDIVKHLDDTRNMISDPVERKLVAELNLKAGEKALASNANESALKYLTTGMEFLDDTPWHSDYNLTSALHIKRLECELLCNNFERAESLFDESLKYLRTPAEKAEIYNIKIVLCANLGRFSEAINLGAEALKMFGVALPFIPGKPAILLQYLKSRQLRARRRREGYSTIAELIRLPEMSNPDRLAVMSILSNIGAPSYLHDKNQFALIAIMMVNLSLEHGNTGLSSFAYGLYGMLIIAAFGEFDAGYEFGNMALRLNENSGDILARGKTAFVFHNFIAHRKKPLHEGADSLKDVFLDSLRSGDLMYAGYSLLARVLHLSTAGATLDVILSESERYLEFLNRVQNEDAVLFVRAVQQTALCLKGKTTGLSSFSSELYDEEQQLAMMKEKKALVPLQGYYLLKSESLYILGDYENALKMAIESDELSEEALCQSYHADHYLYYSLAITATWPGLSWSRKRQFKSILNRNLKKLSEWARHCPENFQHKKLLVAGEIARTSGAAAQAIRLFEMAAISAGENGFVQCEAIACELAAGMYLAEGADTAARTCFVKAHHGYAVWGAAAKVKLLEEKHPDWFAAPATITPAGEETTHTANAASTTTGSGTLDMMTVIKVSQAISGEVYLDRLLNLLIGFVIENAGATRGNLILKRDSGLFIEAEGTADPNSTTVLQALPVDNCSSIPESIINYVARTHEYLVLDDAANCGRFTHDPYIMEKTSKSILCTPIMNQGRMTGVLYLENNLATGAFTDRRLKVLELLSSQIAISIENARLYEGLKKATEELEEYSRTLEQKVDERTRELSAEIDIRKKAEEAAEEANRIKSNFLSTVSHELRTPLTSVLGFARIIRKKLDESVLPALKLEDRKAAKSLGQIREVTEIIVIEGERLTTLIDDVLDLAKMEAGKITWNMQKISLVEIIDRATVAVSSLLEQKNLALVKDVEEGLPEIFGDRDRLIQVVINLLSNAWKFTNEGSITVLARLVGRGTNNQLLKIGITDTGIGISPEDQEKIFEKFKQVGDTLTDKPKGTGLGLPICREIVEYHGGSIWVESELGKGSTFFFTISTEPKLDIAGGD